MSEAGPTDDDLAAQVRAKLQAEHDRRIDRLETRRDRHQSWDGGREDDHRLNRIEREERERFYVEKGYKEYTDTHGRKSMVPPEEWAWRQKRRRKSHKRKGGGSAAWRPKRITPRSVAIYAGIVVLAVFVGLLLAR